MSESFDEKVKIMSEDADWRGLFKERYLDPVNEAIVLVEYMLQNTPQTIRSREELSKIRSILIYLRYRLEAIHYIKEFDPYLKRDEILPMDYEAKKDD